MTEQQPVGIFTLSDVLKRIVLPGTSLDQPISTVMSPVLQTLPMAANAHDAACSMAMHGIRHVLAVDEGGRLKGVIRSAICSSCRGPACARSGTRSMPRAVSRCCSMRATDVRQLSLTMLAEGVGAQEITQFISTLNDTVTRRIIELNLDRHDLYGIDWAWLSFGSEGRDEQTFTTDQDNGIVYICTDIMDRELTQLRFLEFAREVNADLDRCGFPLCKGNIMASNPDLCLTLEEWEERFARWVRTPEPQALLNATIFFDFRPLYGRFNLAHRLRLSLLRQTRGNPLFLRMLAQNALSVSPPLGRIRDFVTGSDPEHPGTIDLKKYGVRLFTDAARVFALAHDVEATNTVQRLKRAGAVMNISSDDLAASSRVSTSSSCCACGISISSRSRGAPATISSTGRTERDRAAHPQGGVPAGTQAAGAPQTRLSALTMTWFSRLFSGPQEPAQTLTAGSSRLLAGWQQLPEPICAVRTTAAATWWSTSKRPAATSPAIACARLPRWPWSMARSTSMMPFSCCLADAEQGADAAPSPAEQPTPEPTVAGPSVEPLIAFLQFVGKAPSGGL
jgi:hypothetical protein